MASTPPGVPPTRSPRNWGTRTEGFPGGAPPEAFSEGPQLCPKTSPSENWDPLRDEDGDEISDYIDKSAFHDVTG